MENEVDILKRFVKKLNNNEEKITLASLKHQANKLTEEKKREARINFKVFSSDERDVIKLDLKQYFCSICGKMILTTNVKLELLPIRATDQAIAVDLQRVFARHFLQKEGLRTVKRESGIETQYRWKCHCGITVGYQSITYDESDKIYDQMHIKRNKDFTGFEISNKPFLYILNDAVVMEAQDSRLLKEVLQRHPELRY